MSARSRKKHSRKKGYRVIFCFDLFAVDSFTHNRHVFQLLLFFFLSYARSSRRKGKRLFSNSFFRSSESLSSYSSTLCRRRRLRSESCIFRTPPLRVWLIFSLDKTRSFWSILRANYWKKNLHSTDYSRKCERLSCKFLNKQVWFAFDKLKKKRK